MINFDDSMHNIVDGVLLAVVFLTEKLEAFLSPMLEIYGTQLLRYKGMLHIADDDSRWAFQGVHMLMGGEQGNAWKPNEKRESVMVFIGKNLPKERFEKALELCLV